MNRPYPWWSYCDANWVNSCAAIEIHSFQAEPDDPKAFIDALNAHNPGRLYHIHFVRYRTDGWGDDDDGEFEDEYQWANVKDYVSKMPGVQCLGPFINNNSDNEVTSYFWLTSAP